MRSYLYMVERLHTELLPLPLQPQWYVVANFDDLDLAAAWIEENKAGGGRYRIRKIARIAT